MLRPACIKAAVFDFDGTLCDTEGHNLRGCQRVFAQLGANVPMEVVATMTGRDDALTVPPLLERYGAHGSYEDYERLSDGNRATYERAPLVPAAGSIELLEALRARGVKTGVVSMTRAKNVLTAMNRLGMVRLFDVLVFGDMVAHKKPAPDPYLKALEFLGVSAGEAVAFEDSPNGIVSAKAAGIYTFGYTGSALVQDVSAADEVIKTFEGLELVMG